MVKRWSVASVSILAANRNPHFGFTMKFGKPWVTAWGELGAMSSVIPVRMEAVRVLQWAVQSHPPAVFLTDRCTRPRILRTLLNMALGLLLKFNPLPNPLWGFGQRSEVSQSFCLNTCQLQAKGGTAFAWMNSVALFFFFHETMVFRLNSDRLHVWNSLCLLSQSLEMRRIMLMTEEGVRETMQIFWRQQSLNTWKKSAI